MNLLGCLFTVFAGLVLLGIGALVALWRWLTKPLLKERTQNTAHANTARPDNTPKNAPKRSKVIGDDEGEYVDFEEINDPKSNP